MTGAPSAEVSLAQQIESEIKAGTVELPVLPEVAVRVQEIIARDGHIGEISAVIEREPTFAASVLRYSNSIAFAGLSTSGPRRRPRVSRRWESRH